MSETKEVALVIAPFGKLPELRLNMTAVRAAEQRYIEAKTVNPSTYADLECSFNESYRVLKDHYSQIGYQLSLAEKELRLAQANVVLGAYAEYLAGKPKAADTSHMKDAFLMKDETYLALLDKVNQLKAFQSNFEGKIKVVENVCRYMRQKMYLVSKSGVPTESIGVTIGKR
jgi:hypothetical protein